MYNKEKVGILWEMLCQNFGEKKSDGFKVILWDLIGREIKGDKHIGFIKIFEYILKNRVYKKFPTVAEFMQAYKHIVNENNEQVEKLALEGFNKFWQAISEAGAYSTVIFDDVVINTVVKIQFQGWINSCKNAKDEYKTFWQKDFVNAYKLYYQDKEKLEYFKLKGITEKNNDTLKFGKSRFNVKYFGDHKKCEIIEKNSDLYLPKSIKGLIELKTM